MRSLEMAGAGVIRRQRESEQGTKAAGIETRPARQSRT